MGFRFKSVITRLCEWRGLNWSAILNSLDSLIKKGNIHMKIVLQHLTKKFPARGSVRGRKNREDVIAVNDFDFEIPDGKLIGLLGPSGCGKSTALNLICGLLKPTEGKIFFGEDDVTGLPPENRGVGMVFQNYALYPHLTVEKNIQFPLENLKGADKLSKEEMSKRVLEAAKLVQIDHLLERKPNELSGGQQQRVAIARALVKMPKVLLLDEPLSNLDARLRLQTREELRRIQCETKITTVFVTHDQEEAMSISDMIIVMKEGVIQQVGKPMELYDHPVNKFVAGFIGSPQMNFFDVTLKGNEVTFEDGNKLMLPEAILKRLNGKEGEMTLGIRGEDLKMDAQNLELYKENKMKAVITDTEVMGNENNLYFQFGGCQAVARVSKYEISQVGDEIEFVFMPSKIHFFDKETEMNYL